MAVCYGTSWSGASAPSVLLTACEIIGAVVSVSVLPWINISSLLGLAVLQRSSSGKSLLILFDLGK